MRKKKPTKKQMNEQIERIAILGIRLADKLLAHDPVEVVNPDGSKTIRSYLPISFYAQIGQLDSVEECLRFQLDKLTKTEDKGERVVGKEAACSSSA